MASYPQHPFWDFSLRVYAGPGVAPACLALQDRHGLDVNLLLLCCWLGRGRPRAPSRDEIARLCAAVEDWHRHVVRPLREARRWLKAPGPAIPADQAAELRDRIKRLELDSEHIEQLALANQLESQVGGGAPPAPEHALAAVGYYFDILGVSPDGADRRALTVVLAAAFPETAPGRLEGLVAGLGAGSAKA